jgi:Carbohydrate family 9 binding domain-like
MDRLLKIGLVVVISAVILACNIPWLNPEPENIFQQPAQTLTAMVQLLPTSTVATIATFAMPTSSPLPTFTPLPTQSTAPHRAGSQVIAKFLTKSPVIDGNWDDWKNLTAIYLATNVINGASRWKNPADLEGSFILGWDNNYLYLAVKVMDDLYVQNSSGAYIYKGDDVELQLDTNLGVDFTFSSMNNDDYQLGISAGKGSINGPKEAYLWYPQIIKGLVTNQVVIASQGGNGIHYVEARIPWNLFGLSPYEGLRVGFALALSDNDNPAVNDWQTMISNNPGRKTLNPTTWGELVLTM